MRTHGRPVCNAVCNRDFISVGLGETSSSDRVALTLIEVAVALVAGSMLFIIILNFYQQGMRTLVSDSNKLTATSRTHLASERIRMELFGTKWAWVVPLADPDAGRPRNVWGAAPEWILEGRQTSDSGESGTVAPPPGGAASVNLEGSPLMYGGISSADGSASDLVEYLFDSKSKKLYIGGEEISRDLAAVLFVNASQHVIKYVLQADEYRGNTRFKAERERSTLVGASYLQAQEEENLFSSVVHETVHAWCTLGTPIHTGYTDH